MIFFFNNFGNQTYSSCFKDVIQHLIASISNYIYIIKNNITVYSKKLKMFFFKYSFENTMFIILENQLNKNFNFILLIKINAQNLLLPCVIVTKTILHKLFTK